MWQSCPVSYTTKYGLRKQTETTTDTTVFTAMACMVNVGKKQWQKEDFFFFAQRFVLHHRISPTVVQLKEVCSFTFFVAYYVNKRNKQPVLQIRSLVRCCYQTTSPNWAIIRNQNTYYVVFVLVFLLPVLIMDSWCFDTQVQGSDPSNLTPAISTTMPLVRAYHHI